MARAGRSAVPALLACLVYCTLVPPRVRQAQAASPGISDELIENAYWEARHTAAELWRSRTPNASQGTMLSMKDHVVRFWDFWGPDYVCPYMRERIGQLGDGGKWVCGVSSLLQRPGCIVFSIGSNGETSFEEAVLRSTGCEMHTYDHTLDAKAVQAVHNVSGIYLHTVGLASKTAAGAGENTQTLATMLAGQHRHWIDVLKMDIEGNEWEVLSDWYASGQGTLPVGQLLVEWHFESAASGLEGTVAPLFAMLAEDGYRVFSVEPNTYCDSCRANLMEYSFIKVSRSGHVYGRGAATQASSPKHHFDA